MEGAISKRAGIILFCTLPKLGALQMQILQQALVMRDIYNSGTAFSTTRQHILEEAPLPHSSVLLWAAEHGNDFGQQGMELSKICVCKVASHFLQQQDSGQLQQLKAPCLDLLQDSGDYPQAMASAPCPPKTRKTWSCGCPEHGHPAWFVS